MLLEDGVCYDQCILLEKPLSLPYFILYSKAKLACYSRYLLTSYFAYQSPVMKQHLFLMLVQESLVSHHGKSHRWEQLSELN